MMKRKKKNKQSISEKQKQTHKIQIIKTQLVFSTSFGVFFRVQKHAMMIPGC